MLKELNPSQQNNLTVLSQMILRETGYRQVTIILGGDPLEHGEAVTRSLHIMSVQAAEKAAAAEAPDPQQLCIAFSADQIYVLSDADGDPLPEWKGGKVDFRILDGFGRQTHADRVWLYEGLNVMNAKLVDNQVTFDDLVDDEGALRDTGHIVVAARRGDLQVSKRIDITRVREGVRRQSPDSAPRSYEDDRKVIDDAIDTAIKDGVVKDPSVIAASLIGELKSFDASVGFVEDIMEAAKRQKIWATVTVSIDGRDEQPVAEDPNAV